MKKVTKQRYFPPTVQTICIPHAIPSLLATMSVPTQIDADWSEFGELEPREWE